MYESYIQYRREIRAPKIHSGHVIAETKPETVVWAHKMSTKRALSLPFSDRVDETLNWFLFFCILRLLDAFGREPNTKHRHVRARSFAQNAYIASPLAQSRATLVLNFLGRN